ncbi:hypothetical protein GCK72_003053 [Caenorhabditis remanei]|uniref:Uncharacterized protein n=1 Tax=Caenorhabditis remanei TaxID=31234 RepID=A0A6A5HXJ0_CAERE|nr:hypothetical protein GCK72_003053 [Caenorhabditis remanei]KAF1771227.1 hypothetical protein GCK72_003053 [Caenorhabditis remanei]
METDVMTDQLAMTLSTKLLNAFDSRNFTEFSDFDVRFTYDQCHKIYEKAEFLKAVEDYRNTFASGTVIKYALISAFPIKRQYNGIQFNVHTEFLGQHHDILVNFQKTRPTLGSMWRWVHAWKLNCIRDDHRVFQENELRQKVLS